MGNPEQENAVDATSKKDNIDFEKRFKDTQSAYTKSQQELKAAKAKLEALEKLTAPKVEVDEETKEMLDSLKYENPEAWRAKLNQLESEAKLKHKQALDEAGKLAAEQAELERRKQVLEEFNRSNPTIVITDDVIQYDIPPRITKKLESGEITFETYLEEVKDFLSTPKTVAGNDEALNQPNLNKVGGGDKPSNQSANKNLADTYENVVF